MKKSLMKKKNQKNPKKVKMMEKTSENITSPPIALPNSIEREILKKLPFMKGGLMNFSEIPSMNTWESSMTSLLKKQ